MKNIYCSFFGHDFKVTKQITYHVKEFKCVQCQEQFTTDESGNLTKLTPKYREINSVLEKVHNKKLRRKSYQAVS